MSLLSKLGLAPTAPAPNPRKVPTGTSYQASGLAAPPPSNESEIGSSRPVVVREIVPQLVTAFQRAQVYAQMMNDAGVDVSMRAGKTPVLGADFFVDPYSDDPLDQEVSDFIWGNLFEGMSSPLCNSLEDILHMYEDGYAILEKTHEEREWSAKRKGANAKNYTMLKKLALRPTNTLTGFTYDDNGGPKTVKQNAIRADGTVEQVEIDISKLVVFTFGRIGGDLTGKSLLRTAYPHWYYKTHFYKIDAIQKERHSLGVPKGKLLAGYKEADKIALRTLLSNLRSNEEAFMILPPSVDVEFAEVHGNLVNVLESADHHNLMILLNVMVQFLALGVSSSSAGGGRATSGSQSDMFMKSLRYIANAICDVINMYVIPELVVWNFPTKNFPKLKVRNIGETRDLQMLGAALANLFSQGGLTSDDPTEEWIRKIFDMPRRDSSVPRAPVGVFQNQPPPATNGNKGGVGNNGGQGNTGKPPGAATQTFDLRMPNILNEYTIEAPEVKVPNVTNENEYKFEHDTHVNIDEGAVQVEVPAPVVHIHMPAAPDNPQQLKPKSAIAKKNKDGSTQIDYEYGD